MKKDISMKEEDKSYMECLRKFESVHRRIYALRADVRDMGCEMVINGERDIIECIKKKEISRAKDLSKWQHAMQTTVALHRKLSGYANALRSMMNVVEDISKSLCNSYPAEYDQEMFYDGWAYQNNLRGKPKHWSVPELDAGQMEACKVSYDKCRALFNDITEGLKTHNFCICIAQEGDFADFDFTCEGVPGKLEVTFPTANRKFLSQDGFINDDKELSMPMSMYITWRFHEVIPIIDRFFGDSYSIKDIKQNLRMFVENEEWRKMLHKRFVVGRNEDGLDIETDEMPESYKKIIEESIAKASEERKE